MNSIDRIMATIQGEKRDRPPLSLTLSLYGAKLIDCPLSEYYTNPEKYVEGQVAVFNEIEPDIIFSPFALSFFGKAFGGEIKMFDDQAPNLAKPFVRRHEDIKKLDFTKALESPEIKYMIDSVNGLHTTLGKDVFIAAIALGPVDLPIMLMSIGGWMDFLLSYQEDAYRLIEKTSKFFLQLTDRLFDAGASAVVMPSAFINPKVVTHGIAKVLLDRTDKTFAKAKGPLILHSGGAKMIPFLEIFQTLSNVAAFVINSDDDLLKARYHLPGKQVIVGNIEGPDLNRLDRGVISEKVKELCRFADNDPYMIPGSSAADIPYDTPIDKILVIKKTLEEIYGC